VILNIESKLVLHETNSSTKVTSKDLFELCTEVDLPRLKIQKLRFFYDQNSGFSCICYYENKNACGFLTGLGGADSLENLMKDVEVLSKWLDQFFLYRISRQQEFIAQIPVFYGQSSVLDSKVSENHWILLSRNHGRNATRIFRYRTALAAPIHAGDVIGWVFYKSAVFSNPIVKHLESTHSIQKAGRLKILLDSMMYLIFGKPAA
jgi:hypothetical protein